MLRSCIGRCFGSHTCYTEAMQGGEGWRRIEEEEKEGGRLAHPFIYSLWVWDAQGVGRAGRIRDHNWREEC